MTIGVWRPNSIPQAAENSGRKLPIGPLISPSAVIVVLSKVPGCQWVRRWSVPARRDAGLASKVANGVGDGSARVGSIKGKIS